MSTMKMLKRYGKIIIFDSLATLCFIGVILFGWLPGPGGIPLFLAGLALLAVNHDWAERWLETARHKGKSFKNILFPNNRLVRITYDIVSVLVFASATYLFFNVDNRFVTAFSLALASLSLLVFLFNRERLDKISTTFKKKP